MRDGILQVMREENKRNGEYWVADFDGNECTGDCV
jgi:hypothetical protein